MLEVKRSERGWAGHYICADRCSFRRNTLLEAERVRVVVSTVGCKSRFDGEDGYEEIGIGRHYETMAFHARRVQRTYWDANVRRQISFESPWAISKVDNYSDAEANAMHEKVVEEIYNRLASGDKF